MERFEITGIPHLEGLQIISSMSQNKVGSIIDHLEIGVQQTVKDELKAIESEFDMNYLQLDGDYQIFSTLIFVCPTAPVNTTVSTTCSQKTWS